ncbi:hypothetical protein C7447_101510 [Tenacibaculum adriaticum]|uniref:Subunit length determinant protein n=1 Tax=Tenacibaculum adriaticum TaxID=413713 RepID=A0A5S5DVE3_9FLAO|nr:hypothetical protein [Tenacibaculum adriaticum]TYP99903.1 hypothetical protein C7447_101510 [Tenacibaculum adriaticum]
MPNINKNSEEEVDLGSLFVIIGKGFSNFFSFIGSLFNSIFDFFIQVLLFLKSNIIKIGLAAIIGGVLGIFIEYTNNTKYVDNLQVQPNFKSSRQLYNNINYYNDLVKQKDTALLAKTFNISMDDAASLRKFEIYPIINENDILTSYDELILSVDTLTVKSYSFNKFKNMFTQYDYQIHNINVQATKNNIFKKLDKAIIGSITENEYFNNLRKINNENLSTTELLIRKNLAQADSLHYVYKKVLLEEAKKTTSGTNIDLGGKQSISKELELFKTNRELNKDLKKISEDLAEKTAVINVISNFQPVGHEIKEIQKNQAFQFALLGAILMILLLLLIKLNRYLENYQN